MYLAHRPVITVNKICKTYDILRSECTGAIGDPKPARTSPYDGTEPVILLRPEDMHARVNHNDYTLFHVHIQLHYRLCFL